MANEEWRNYRERRNYPQHGLTNYYNHSTTSNNSNSYIHHRDCLHGQSHFHSAEPIHRRREGLLENTSHTSPREYFHYHDRTLHRSFSTGLSYPEHAHHTLHSDSGTSEFTGTYPDHYPRTYSNPCPDRAVFHTPGLGAFRPSSAHYGPYDDSVPDPRFHRYVLRDPTVPLPFYDPNQGAQYRRSQSLLPLNHSSYYSDTHSTVNSDFPPDQSLSKQHTFMDHNIESQYHSSYTKRPSQHDQLPISDKNNTTERIHIYHTAGSPEPYFPQNSRNTNDGATTTWKRQQKGIKLKG